MKVLGGALGRFFGLGKQSQVLHTRADLMVLDYTAALEVSAPRLPRLAQAAVAA